MASTLPAGAKITINGGTITGSLSGAGTIKLTGYNNVNRVGLDGASTITGVTVEINDDLTLYRANTASTDSCKLTNATLDIDSLNVDATLILDGSTAETTDSDDSIDVESNGLLYANGRLNAKLSTVSGASIGVYGDGAVLTLDNADNNFYATTSVYQSTGTGYLSSLYSLDNLSAAGNNVVIMQLTGTSVTALTASITVQTATLRIEKQGTGNVRIERKSGNSWIFCGNDVTSVSVAGDEGRVEFRAWDGSHFVYASPCQRTYYLINESGGSFANAADWALDPSLSIVCTHAPTIAGNVFDCRYAS